MPKEATDLQQQILVCLDQFKSLEEMRDHAEEIAGKLDCSKQYVFRMIKKREADGVPPQIQVEPQPPEIQTEGSEESADIESEVTSPDKDEIPEDVFTEPDKKQTEQQSIDQIVSVENVGTLIGVPFRLVAIFTDFSGWELTDQEKTRLSPMAKQLLLKYLPEIMTKYFAEVVFAVVLLEVVGEKGKKWRAAQKETQAQAEVETKAKAEVERKEAGLKQVTPPAPEAPTPEAPASQEPTKPKTKEEAGSPRYLREGLSIG